MMIQDQLLMAAVSKIFQRSERQEDVEKLNGTYVDVGLLPQLNNQNHQVFYGRRGTGKTHIMKVLQNELSKSNDIVVYIDCRTLGSTDQFSDPNAPMQKRCLSLFRDILLCVYHEILEYIVEHPNANFEKAFTAADELSNIITDPVKSFITEKLTTETSLTQSVSITSAIGVEASNEGIKGTANTGKDRSVEEGQQRSAQYSVISEDKVIFPELQRAIKQVLELADTRLYILIDEWSSLPLDIQPFLAEFIKRGVLPLTIATVKISALEYRCRFSVTSTNGILGFELGADIATALDLDDYFVFDRNPDHIVNIYAEVLMKHISSELPFNYLKDKVGINTPQQFYSKMFTEGSVFRELARASEGVIRDLINIFTQAYFHAQRRGRTNIDKQAVVESAQKWFEQDKAQYLDDHLTTVMRRIVDEVIGKRSARSFMLSRELEKNSIIQRLFDARVLHHMRRGYADKDNPGLRYNIYAIDYGAYVDLIGTSKQPQIDLGIPDEAAQDIIVPFDDNRSIRRIILNEEILV